MSAVLAALPVVVACGALAGRVSASRAAALALAACALLVPLAFPLAPGRLADVGRTNLHDVRKSTERKLA